MGDPEGLTRVDVDGETFLIAASSLCFRDADGSGQQDINDGLVRVRYTAEGDLHAEAMLGFRSWLLSHEPSLAEAGELEPDAGGLNIEGACVESAHERTPVRSAWTGESGTNRGHSGPRRCRRSPVDNGGAQRSICFARTDTAIDSDTRDPGHLLTTRRPETF